MNDTACRKTWKLPSKAKQLALDLCRQGWTTSAIAKELTILTGTQITPQAIWQLRNRNAAALRQTLNEELEQAIALSPLSTLACRLLELEKVVDIALQGYSFIRQQLHADNLELEDRKKVVKAIGECSRLLPLALDAVKTADTAVSRMKYLELALKRQMVKKDGFDRCEVEAAIIAVQARNDRHLKS